MIRPFKHRASSSQGGFIIIAVLWILVALSALATIFSMYLSNSARALGATDAGVQVDALVSASLELTAYQLLSADEKAIPAQGSFRFRMDNAEVLVTFTSEAARVDLNAASKEMLAGLFEVLGAEQKAAAELADRIVGWRTQSKPGAADDEGALYLAAGLNYSPRQAHFAHVNELSLVLGASPVLVERALPYVTVFSKSADIDVLIAPPEVIAALPGMTPEILNNFLKQRPSLPHDQKAIVAALDPVKATLPETRAFRVLTTLRFDNGRRTSSEAVILLGNAKGSDKANTSASDKGKDEDKRPYSILSWQDQVETVSRPLKQAGR
ncbi:MAG TPA: type II secretion system minor pseudopilin GspK [Bradyrhizobium sp.]|jgi:general secretion pathway protein K|nr:type II secretion system minor pseudopilin GspK [Bradyrhizobium sp.]